MKIWLIGGTSESVALANLLVKAQLHFIVTATTPQSQLLYPSKNSFAEVAIGKMDLEQIRLFLKVNQIKAVVDASHPYAVVISQNAMAATAAEGIPYLRYNRPQVTTAIKGAIELNSFNHLCQGNYLQGERVLFTIGYQNLPLFRDWQERSCLFARILPNLEALEVALEAGFTANRLIAVRPPVSLALEKALWQQWQITTVVTKASGKAGGEEIKRKLSEEMGVNLIIITRPQLNYCQQTSKMEEVLSFCRYFKENIN